MIVSILKINFLILFFFMYSNPSYLYSRSNITQSLLYYNKKLLRISYDTLYKIVNYIFKLIETIRIK